MNSEELRSLTESYYRDVYDYDGIDEELTGSRRAIAKYMFRDMHNKLGNLVKGTPEHTALDDKIGLLQHISGRSEAGGIGSKEDGYPDLKGPTKRGGRGSRGGPKTVAQSIPLDRPIGGSDQDKISRDKAVARHARKMSRRKPNLPESQDFYDTVLEHLITEGYADDVRAAQVIMTHMSDEWLGDIMEAFNEKGEFIRDKNSPLPPSAPAPSKPSAGKSPKPKASKPTTQQNPSASSLRSRLMG